MFAVAEVAAAVGSGYIVRQTLEQIQLPKLVTSDAATRGFKLSVRVLSAAVPGIAAPGFFSRQRPYLVTCFADSEKLTEMADFDASAQDCPWRFGDVITFSIRLEDLRRDPALHLRLHASSDITVGPLQLQLKSAEVGEAQIDLIRRVLPGCVLERQKPESRQSWVSPLMLVPMAHIRGGLCGANLDLGEAVAHVALAFGVDADPEAILEAIELYGRSVSRKLEEKADDVMRWLSKPVDMSCPWMQPAAQEQSAVGCQARAAAAAARAATRAWHVTSPEKPLKSPEAEPENWLRTHGPDGRTYFHHRVLGPAPWDSRAPREHSLPDPEELPETWISKRGADGRLFWHNTVLGPAPWD